MREDSAYQGPEKKRVGYDFDIGCVFRNDAAVMRRLLVGGSTAMVTVIAVIFRGVPRLRGGMVALDNPISFWAAIVFGVVVALSCLLLVWYRIHKVRRILENGRTVVGTITRIQEFHFMNLLAEFVFDHDDRQIRGRNELARSSGALQLHKGTRVLLVIDPHRPKRALLAEFFTPQCIAK